MGVLAVQRPVTLIRTKIPPTVTGMITNSYSRGASAPAATSCAGWWAPRCQARRSWRAWHRAARGGSIPANVVPSYLLALHIVAPLERLTEPQFATRQGEVVSQSCRIFVAQAVFLPW